MRIGITGQSGFIGSHLHNTISLSNTFEIVPFLDSFFSNPDHLRDFVSKCDVIVHLAAVNRHPDEQIIYETNISLANLLLSALNSAKTKPHIIFASSIQESNNSLYGKSKTVSRELLANWAFENNAKFTGLLIPNVFGPFSKPNYNTFIATFADQIINGIQPKIIDNNTVRLIYVSSLCNHIINVIQNNKSNQIEKIVVPHDFERNVKDILELFNSFNHLYIHSGTIPLLSDINDINLFNTFRSYINHSNHFPFRLNQNCDNRGLFVEIMKSSIAGQISFSTTKPGITRGNHFHTRKIERFVVIQGKALIKIRKIDSNEVIDFLLDGRNPSFVDIPIWYTHNMINIGEEDLITMFWINEWYDPNNGDTYFMEV